jgi:squalene-associated FAD-dependent desaturase
MPRTIHIIGAGMAGLSAALQLTLMGEKVAVYEAAPYAGGRCRSYYDRELDCRIDNGNHLVLSGNVAVQDYLQLTKAHDTLTGPQQPIFPFMDLGSGERWLVRMDQGRIPFWIFDPQRRVAGTKPADYLGGARLLTATASQTVAQLMNTQSALYQRFIAPLTIAALNTEPEIASAALLKNILVQSFLVGGKACLPLIPKEGLSETFVQPCMTLLQERGTQFHFGERLRRIVTEESPQGPIVRQLDFGTSQLELSDKDWIILAVPPWVAAELIPTLTMPNEFRAIANLHYRVEAPSNMAGFTGLTNSVAEWVFTRGGIVSVTISAADRYTETKHEDMAAQVWQELAKLFDLDPARVPPWRLVREKRATFAATPAQQLRRPKQYIGWKNLALAGDWTDTALPSTIEGSIRSGMKAAQVVVRWGS